MFSVPLADPDPLDKGGPDHPDAEIREGVLLRP